MKLSYFKLLDEIMKPHIKIIEVVHGVYKIVSNSVYVFYPSRDFWLKKEFQIYINQKV
jgi:hypothetical protein